MTVTDDNNGWMLIKQQLSLPIKLTQIPTTKATTMKFQNYIIVKLNKVRKTRSSHLT